MRYLYWTLWLTVFAAVVALGWQSGFIAKFGLELIVGSGLVFFFLASSTQPA